MTLEEGLMWGWGRGEKTDTVSERALVETIGHYRTQRLTLEMVRGMLKSLPPCSLKPQGAGPSRDTL